MTSKALNNLSSKVIAVCKEIKLHKPSSGNTTEAQFIPTGKIHRISFGGLGVTIWYDDHTIRRLCKEISQIAKAHFAKLKELDINYSSGFILEILKQNILDDKYFNSDHVFFRKVNNLFEARINTDIEKFANVLIKIIVDELSSLSSEWIFIYPLDRNTSISYAYKDEGIFILNPSDEKFWKQFIDRFSSAKYWDPKTGKNIEDKGPLFGAGAPRLWLICISNGTETSSRHTAAFKMRKFISVLFSHLYSEYQNITALNLSQPNTYALQIPENEDNTGVSQIIASVGKVLPSIAQPLDISHENLRRIKNWYNSTMNMNKEKQRRVTVASHFINSAIFNNDYERFINFFIALDALFGEANKVKKSILSGVDNLFKDIKIKNKMELLYELRSEIVHGGCSTLLEWKKYEHYERTFNTNPMQDVEYIAMNSLLCYSVN